jgi:lycopene cyclase domain-containing protein
VTYASFLGLFLGIPLTLLGLLTLRAHRQGATLPPNLNNLPAWLAVGAHVIIALAYTTPWDNYLVANRVWWYNPELVTGYVIGWVPLEEYIFFALQSLLTGLWLTLIARYLPHREGTVLRRHLRWLTTGVAGLIWAGAVVTLLGRWESGIYLALELAWALPPIILQLMYGADILWRHQTLVLPGILLPTLYLSLADAVAIGYGTWTINPGQSTGVLLGGRLPVEEFIFFLLTNTLLVFGITLLLAHESGDRLRNLKPRHPER